MGSVDHEVRSIHTVSLADSLEEFGVVHDSFLHESDQLVLHVDSLLLEVVQFTGEFVFQLALVSEEGGFVDVVESHFVFGERFEEVNLLPCGDSVSRKISEFDSHSLSSSHEVHSTNVVSLVVEVGCVGPPD